MSTIKTPIGSAISSARRCIHIGMYPDVGGANGQLRLRRSAQPTHSSSLFPMLVARSSRCATRDIVRNTVSRQARATLATAGDHPAQRTTTNTTEPNHLVTSGSRRVFFLRPWVGVPSMALGLAVLRAFELQYGKLRDIRLGQVSR